MSCTTILRAREVEWFGRDILELTGARVVANSPEEQPYASKAANQRQGLVHDWVVEIHSLHVR